MDPVTALGLAATAIQFLDWGLEALKLCQQIRDDFQGASKANREVDSYAKELKNMSKELEVTTTTTNKAGKRISKIAKDCLTLAEKLQALLSDIRRAGNANVIDVAKTAFRTMKGKRTIEKLQNELKERRALLDSVLIQDIRNRVDLAAIQQSEQFTHLKTTIQKLVVDLQSQQAANEQYIRRTNDKLAEIQAQNQYLAASSSASHSTTQKKIDVLHSGLSSEFSKLHVKAAKEALLDSLYFLEHTTRREKVALPAFDTFDWIFDGDRAPVDAETTTSKAKSGATWPKFSDWLECSSSLYWITGKAGSGKSTMMAHIVDDDRTRTGLEKWACHKPVNFFSFFFWRPGTQLQQSVDGLLRSLVFQVLNNVSNLTERLLQEIPFPSGRIPAWTTPKLCQLLQTALRLATDFCFCFFVDGLDEFDGDYHSLLDIIFELQSSGHVKFCVSSRPETIFKRRLSAYAHLRMEDLNYEDICTFVFSKLDFLDPTMDIPKNITRRAEGVFLWAALATQSIVQGVESEDDEETLLERVYDLPDGLSAMFQHMLLKVQHVHRKSIGLFFRVMELLREPNIAIIAALSLGDGNINGYDDLWAKCAKLKQQIIAQSCGLLLVSEKTSISPHVEDDACRENCRVWAIPKSETSSLLFSDPEAAIAARQVTSDIDTVMQFAVWWDTDISWIHRSAFDFVFSGESDSREDFIPMPSKTQVVDNLGEALFRLWSICPNHTSMISGLPHSGSQDVLGRLFYFLGDLQTLFSTDYNVHLDHLEFLVTQLNIEEAESLIFPGPALNPTKSRTTGYEILCAQLCFWRWCSRVDTLRNYVHLRLSDIAARERGCCLLIALVPPMISEIFRGMGEILDTAVLDTVAWILEMLHSLIQEKGPFWNPSSTSPVGTRGLLFRPWALYDWQKFECADMDGTIQEHMVAYIHEALTAILDRHLAFEQLPQIDEIAESFTRLFELWQMKIAGHLSKNVELKRYRRIQWQLDASAVLPFKAVSSSPDWAKLTATRFDVWLEIRYGPHQSLLVENEANQDLVHLRFNFVGGSILRWLYNCANNRAASLHSEEFYDLALKEIWLNKDDQLDAWQQLCAVACIRIARRRCVYVPEHRSYSNGFISPRQWAEGPSIPLSSSIGG